MSGVLYSEDDKENGCKALAVFTIIKATAIFNRIGWNKKGVTKVGFRESKTGRCFIPLSARIFHLIQPASFYLARLIGMHPILPIGS